MKTWMMRLGLAAGLTGSALARAQNLTVSGTTTSQNLTVNGNIGVGTATPQTRIHVQSGHIAAQGNTNQFVQLWYDNAIIAGSSGGCCGGLRFGRADDLGASGFVEQMKLTTAGDLGIGTSAPQTKLHLVRQDWTGIRIETPGTGDAYIQLVRPGDSNGIVQIGYAPWGGGYINAGGFSPGTGRMLALNYGGGFVAIGSGTADRALSVTNGGASKAQGGGFWDVYSDVRLKDIDGAYEPGIAELMKLSPIRFHYKKGNALGLPAGFATVGIKAQEVQGAIPEAVSRNDKGYLMVNNDPIFWAMVNGIKQQQKQLDAQKELLERQGRELEQLRAAVRALAARNPSPAAAQTH
jgi:hypothetical protein